MRPRRRVRLLVFVGAAALVAAAALAQGGRFDGFGVQRVLPNIPYDGRFTFIRLRYGFDRGFVSQRIPWSHDYPAGERHFMRILDELSYLKPHTEETNILGLDDPELFKYPLAYMCEPGYWSMTDAEALAFRAYLRKGGFVIFDDFRGREWDNFETQLRRVLPEGRIVDLDASHPVFHSFFEIPSLDIVPQFYDVGKPMFRGVFEDNDPSKRLMAIINYNTDISEFWEFSDSGVRPIQDSNEAYKMGVNYIIYGLTH